MGQLNESELVTIGQAVELLQQEFPEVTISSLRFLEREGLLTPQRKPGGHRLFSDHDLERARRIKRWQAERMSLREIRRLLDRAPEIGDEESAAKRITALLFRADIAGAMGVLEDVHRAGVPLMTVCDNIITPVLRSLGDDRGNHLIPVDVQMELDQELIAFLSRATSSPGHLPGKPIVVAACPPWERHDIPLRMLVSLLTERGASVHYIGAQVDGEFVRDAIIRLDPDFLLISMTVPPPHGARNWFQALIHVLRPEQKLFLGGMGSRLLNTVESSNLEILGTESYAVLTRRLLAHHEQSVSGER